MISNTAAGEMRAAILHGKEDVRIESVAVPDLAPGEMLVRVRTALTCGTDVKVFRRGYHAKMLRPPILFGHELSGDVVALGRDVTAFRPGDRIVAANSAPCGQCYFCLKNQPNLCDDLLFNNGAYAEYIRIPARLVSRNTYHIPEHLDYASAALAEPLACALRAIDECGVQPGDTVAVLGLGSLGLMLVRLAREVAGARVIAVARRLEQIDRAVMLGAHTGILLGETPDSLIQQVRTETGQRGADVVIEAIGQPHTWELAVQLVRKGGVVNFFGGCPAGTSVNLDTTRLHYSEITCKASFHHTPDHFQRALDLIARGVITSRQFVNDTAPLERLPAVLKELVHHRAAQVKTAIIP